MHRFIPTTKPHRIALGASGGLIAAVFALSVSHGVMAQTAYREPVGTPGTYPGRCNVSAQKCYYDSTYTTVDETTTCTSDAECTNTGFPEFQFLNASESNQQKTGTLAIGLTGDASRLCLNNFATFPSASGAIYPIADGAGCISSWADVENSGPVTGSWKMNATLLADFTGFIRVKAADAAQSYTSIFEAPNMGTNVGIALKADDMLPGVPSSTNYAGFFSGSVLVGENGGSENKSLCLNESNAPAGLVGPSFPTSYGCISKWTDLFYPANGSAYLQLQSTSGVPSYQSGQVSISSSAQLGALVVGSAAGMPLAMTCGDGMCSAGETSQNCAVDCGAVIPITTFLAYPGNNRVAFETNSWSASVTQQVIVLRKEGSAPTASPVNGVSYTVGQTLGDATVVFSGQVSPHQQNPEIPNADADFFSADSGLGLQNGHQYFYVAIPANSYPRYGAATAPTSARPSAPSVPVSVRVSPSGTASVTLQPAYGDGTYIQAGASTGNGTYVSGTKVILDYSGILSGRRVSSISVSGVAVTCSPSGNNCLFVITNPTNIVVNTSSSSSGPGGGPSQSN